MKIKYLINFKTLLRDIPIKQKLIRSFSILGVASAIVGIISITCLIKTNLDYSNAMKNYGFSQGTIGKLGISFKNSTRLLRDITMLTQLDEVKRSKESLKESIHESEELFNEISLNNTNDEETKIYNEIQSLYGDYSKIINQIMFLDLGNKNNQDLKTLSDKAIESSDDISNKISELLEIKVNNANYVMANLRNLQYILIIIIIISIVFMAIISIKLSKNIANLIGEPINKIKDVTKEISNGNLDAIIESNSKDEIGQLSEECSIMAKRLKSYISDLKNVLEELSKGDLSVSTSVQYKGEFIQLEKSIDKILSSLSETFNEIIESVGTVKLGSNKLYETSKILSKGAMEQTESIDELSKSIDEINEQSQNSFNKIANTDDLIGNFIERVEEGEKKMKLMLDSMSDIEKSSANVKKIIGTISTIAEQTNLLALNAAIEAARAGESGKGFTVVAEEVRRLAEKSKDAVSQTTKLIENTHNSVNKGKNLADETEVSLKEIVENVQNVKILLKDVTHTSKEQSKYIELIKEKIESISNVIQSNSYVAEENTQSSEELTTQAKILDDMLKKFKLKKEASI